MAEPLPYRCPDCSSRDRPTYTTWSVTQPRDEETASLGVSCGDCGSLWGVAVVSGRPGQIELASDESNLRLAREVVTADDDLEAAVSELEDEPSELEGWDFDLRGHRCRYCDETVVPSTGLIPAADDEHVLSVTAQYCPECRAVLDVTWG